VKKFFKSKKNILILAAAVMAAVLIFGKNFSGLMHNMFMIQKLNKENASLDEEYKRLTEEYEKIQNGDVSHIEEAARVKYHMSQKGEIEFRIKKEAQDK
jgi:cell division protein FtsB